MKNSFNKTILDNGLRIITIPQDSVPSATVLVMVEAGSKYETKEINGLSHFLEHMCFKGTAKRPTSISITSELDALGAEYNAFTSHEVTAYFVKSQAKHLSKTIEIVSDLYLNPLFDAKEIDKERGVIIEEINMYEDTPMRRVQELFTTLLYGDQPAGWDVAGTKENILKLTREDFLKYRGAHYLAPATTVVVAGSFDEKKVIESVKNYFKDMPTDGKAGKKKTIEKQNKPEIMVKHKESDQTHIVVGVRAFDIFDNRRFALQVMSNIMGGGMSSRLFQKVREELGAAYYINSSASLFTDHGYFEVSAGVDQQKLKKVVEAIMDEFRKMSSEKVSEAELRRAKDHLSGGLIIGLETSDQLAGFYGEQEIIQKNILSPEEVLEKVQAVTAEDILSIAKEIFKNEKLNLALIGPIKEKKELETLLRI